jgi:hypothetical protein
MFYLIAAFLNLRHTYLKKVWWHTYVRKRDPKREKFSIFPNFLRCLDVGTIVCRGLPVEKHCLKQWSVLISLM